MANFINIGRVFTSEKLTVSTAVKQLTQSVFDDVSNASPQPNQQYNNRLPATKALIVVEAQSLRYTTDGTTPVATSVGILAVAGAVIILESYEELVKFKAVREGASDSTIQVTYYRNS